MTTDISQSRESIIQSPAQPPKAVVVSPKGGCGKTAVASNLAMALAVRRPSLLLDLNLHSGDVEWAFGVQPAYRLNDIARVTREDSAPDVGTMLTPYGEHLSLICCPDSHVAADGVLSSDVVKLARRLVTLQRPMVIDTSPGMSDFTLDAIEIASHILLVTTTDVAAVHAAGKLIDTLEALRIDASRISLIVNRATSRIGLSVRDVEQRLGRQSIMEIPESRHIAAALNIGRPVVDAHPDSHIAGDFLRFADHILGHTSSKRHGFWRIRRS
jgi:pilus assembly protein CpaE